MTINEKTCELVISLGTLAARAELDAARTETLSPAQAQYLRNLATKYRKAQADVLNQAALTMDRYHAYVEKSRCKPYICGICGRNITHPYHQLALPLTVALPQPIRQELEPEPEEQTTPINVTGQSAP